MWSRVTKTRTLAELLQADNEDSQGHGGLVRSLGTLDLLAIGVGSTVGTGVFSITGQVAHAQAGPAVFLCWIIGGIGCLLSALSYMELSAKLPVTGSVYAFSYFALGEVFAVIGAACITLEYGISASAVAANWSDKIISLFTRLGAHNLASALATKVGPVTLSLPALVVLMGVMCMIRMGGALGKTFSRGSSTMAVLLIIAMSVVALTAFDSSHFESFIPPELGIGGLLGGSVTTFFGFLGYDEVCCMAGEAKNPKRSIPLAVIGTLSIATLLPVFGSLALVGMVPYQLIDDKAGFEVAFHSRGWVALSHAVSVGELLVLFVVIYNCFLAQPRVFYALAKDGLLPKSFLAVDSRGNLSFATYATGLLLILLGALLPFDLLANAISGGVLVAFTLVNCCVIVLRKNGSSRRVGNTRFLGLALAVFAFSCTLAITCGLKTSAGIAYVCAAGAFVGITLLALVAIVWQMRGMGSEQAEGDEAEGYFRVPCVPVIPLLAMVFNCIMLASLELRDFALLVGYLCLVLVPYFLFVLVFRAHPPSESLVGTSCQHLQES